MGRTELPQTKLREVLAGFHEHRRLVTVLRTMALELERVNEDNAQLRAAILIYREVLRRSGTARQPVENKRSRAAGAASAGGAGTDATNHQNSQRARSTLVRK